MGKLFPLWLVSFSQFLTMLIWFNYSSIMPSVREEWGLTSSEAGIILSSFQFGYLISVLIFGYLSDRINPRIIFIYSALVAGVGGLGFGLYADGFWSGLIARIIAGIGLGGIYVPGLKYLSGIYPPETRGKIFGIYVGALVVGSGGSLLISSPLIGMLGWRQVVIFTSLGAFAAAVMMLLYRVNISLPKSPPKISLKLLKSMLANKQLVSMNIAYAGHMWELYAFWGWIGPYMVYTTHLQGYDLESAQRIGNFWAGIFIVVGALGTWLGGQLSDVKGRVEALKPLLLFGLVCSVIFGWISSTSLILLIVIGVIYGITVAGDSPIYSVSISELSSANTVGLALGLQQVLGYGITILSPSIFGFILSLIPDEKIAWGVAFTILAIGPLVSMAILPKEYSLKDASHILHGNVISKD